MLDDTRRFLIDGPVRFAIEICLRSRLPLAAGATRKPGAIGQTIRTVGQSLDLRAGRKYRDFAVRDR
jgi:hypothetical protein